jgi:glycosyltransferase involved in cell wall biosynthesis
MVVVLKAELSPQRLPFVSIVISFHNEGTFLDRCVSSLLDQSYPSENCEIILVNDGSNDKSEENAAELARAHPDRIRILNQTDRGPAAGRNLGVRSSRGSIIAFTDPDCVAKPDWLSKHVKNYASDEVGGVEGKVETDWDQLIEPIIVSPAGYRYVTCNMSYRRDVLQKVGLFDEDFRWKEDDDLAYGVMEAGWKIISDDTAVIYHPVKKRNVRGLIRVGLRHRYDVRFYQKHQESAKKYFRMVKLGPVVFTREFFIVGGACLALLIGVAGLLSGNVIALLPLIVTCLWLVLHGRTLRRRKVRASIVGMSVYILFIEVGRLWGSFKFRKFFL